MDLGIIDTLRIRKNNESYNILIRDILSEGGKFRYKFLKVVRGEIPINRRPRRSPFWRQK